MGDSDLTSVGFIPAATALQPSRKMLRVRMVAVVVPEGVSEVMSCQACSVINVR